MKYFKKSLRMKLSLIMIGMIILFSVSNICLSNLFLTKYYLYGKIKSLESVFEHINDIYADWPDNNSKHSEITDQVYLELEQMSQNKNFSIIIYRDYNIPMFGYSVQTDAKLLLYSSLGRLQSGEVESSNIYNDYMNASKKDSEIKEKKKAYVIKKMNVERLGLDYLYLDGKLKNNDHILIRSSISGITESVSWSNRFFLYISVVIAVLGFLVMYIITNRFLGPITVLTGIAKRMSELDFTVKYEVNTEDEVGILGNTMNMLSETLESTLAKLQQANAELKKDLAEKEKIDAMRKEFLSNVSHELKTPIALIQGYAEGLADNITEDAESREFYCEVIMDEAQKMNQMVKKIMALNQLEFGYSQINLSNFDIIELINGVLSKLDILLKQKNVILHFDANREIIVISDAYLIEEVLTNYVTNALNHVDGRRQIEIQVQEEAEQLIVSVYNDGDQIPENDLSLIWEKFYKVDKARTREYGGSGVGLSIVKATMELLNQSYGVCNMPEGVKFWISLPYNKKR